MEDWLWKVELGVEIEMRVEAGMALGMKMRVEVGLTVGVDLVM